MADGVEAHRLEVALAEYKTLRDEIDRRSREQHTLLTLNLTANAAILAVALSRTTAAGSRIALPLLVPVLSSVFALVWLDHDRVIEKIGRYVDGKLTSSISLLVDDRGILGWKDRDADTRHEVLARVEPTLAYGTVFTLLPAVVLGYLNPWRDSEPVPPPHGAVEALWWFGFVLVALVLSRWIRFLLRPSTRR